MNILIVDNYDSFTYNLFHYVQQFCRNISVIKNDKINLTSINKFDMSFSGEHLYLLNNTGLIKMNTNTDSYSILV